MRATRINHVSIHADDMETSVRFYEELLGVERLATPQFPGMDVQWLRLGDQQLHIFIADTPPPQYHHLALDVDDFHAVYTKAREMGLLDPETYGVQLRHHPAGWVQMYIRDPAGNLVEIDWPDISTLDPAILSEIVDIEEQVDQVGDQRIATLYTAGSAVES